MNQQLLETIIDAEQQISSLQNQSRPALQNTSVMELVTDCIHRNGWQFLQQAENALIIAFKSENYQWDCYVQVLEPEKQLMIYSALPISLAVSQQQAAIEKITRLNYGLKIGNFDLDVENMTILYKTSLDLENMAARELVDRLFHSNLSTVDKLLPKFADFEVS